jgi:hypothetical protein
VEIRRFDKKWVKSSKNPKKKEEKFVESDEMAKLDCETFGQFKAAQFSMYSAADGVIQFKKLRKTSSQQLMAKLK